MSKKKHTKRLYHPVIIIALTISAVLISLVVSTNLLLQLDLSSKNIQNSSFTYTLLPRSEQIVSGEPVNFTIRVSRAGKIVNDHLFMAGITHTSGIFIDERSDDIGTFKKYITNSKGEITVPFSPKFRYWNYDRGFGLGIYPILSNEEKAQREQLINTSVISTPLNDAATFDITVYPYWLNWFIFRQ